MFTARPHFGICEQFLRRNNFIGCWKFRICLGTCSYFHMSICFEMMKDYCSSYPKPFVYLHVSQLELCPHYTYKWCGYNTSSILLIDFVQFIGTSRDAPSLYKKLEMNSQSTIFESSESNKLLGDTRALEAEGRFLNIEIKEQFSPSSITPEQILDKHSSLKNPSIALIANELQMAQIMIKTILSQDLSVL